LVVAALAAMALPGVVGGLDATRRSAFLLGVLYFALNVAAAWASRRAHRFEKIERRRAPFLWFAVGLVGVLVLCGSSLGVMVPGLTGIAVLGFLLLVLLENIWRPLFLDRLDDVSDSSYGAAVLSVEAQFQSVGVMLCAPAVGRVADRFGIPGVGAFVIAAAVATGLYSYGRKGAAKERRVSIGGA
jgi:hypothetical protein